MAAESDGLTAVAEPSLNEAAEAETPTVWSGMETDHSGPVLPAICPAVLRRWNVADEADLVRCFRDPKVQAQSWPSSETYTERHAREYLVDRDDNPATSMDLQWAIISRSTGELWGCASLYAIRRAECTASIGYWLTADARGRGIATLAAITLSAWAHSELGIDRLELTCGPENHASRRVAERAGFTLEAVTPSAIAFKGGRRDSLLFSLHQAVSFSSTVGGCHPDR